MAGEGFGVSKGAVWLLWCGSSETAHDFGEVFPVFSRKRREREVGDGPGPIQSLLAFVQHHVITRQHPWCWTSQHAHTFCFKTT